MSVKSNYYVLLGAAWLMEKLHERASFTIIYRGFGILGLHFRHSISGKQIGIQFCPVKLKSLVYFNI